MKLPAFDDRLERAGDAEPTALTHKANDLLNWSKFNAGEQA